MPRKKAWQMDEYVHKQGEPWQVVTVEWMDAVTRDRWMEEGSQPLKAVPCVAVGLLKNKTKEEVTVVQNVEPAGDYFGELTIPRGMVKGIVGLGEVESQDVPKR